MEKINIAELLKDCPQGMELDCTIYDECTLGSILEGTHYPVKLQTPDGALHLTKYGSLSCSKYAKCLIFPKGKTTWEGFVPPCNFKDGDIVYIRDEYSNATFTYVAILKQIKGEQIYSHCFYNYEDNAFGTHDFLYNDYNIRFATEEEKQKLFQAIKDNDYKWNAETKTLEKFTEPKFKAGIRIRHKENGIYCTLGEYAEGISAYLTNIGLSLTYKDLEQWELVPNKFDITTLKPFESRVLVRDTNTEKWKSNFWGFYDIDCAMNYPYECCGNSVAQCIPYEGNEHLLGTTNDCDDFYKTW